MRKRNQLDDRAGRGAAAESGQRLFSVLCGTRRWRRLGQVQIPSSGDPADEDCQEKESEGPYGLG